jgi:hypothetical protein
MTSSHQKYKAMLHFWPDSQELFLRTGLPDPLVRNTRFDNQAFSHYLWINHRIVDPHTLITDPNRANNTSILVSKGGYIVSDPYALVTYSEGDNNELIIGLPTSSLKGKNIVSDHFYGVLSSQHGLLSMVNDISFSSSTLIPRPIYSIETNTNQNFLLRR